MNTDQVIGKFQVCWTVETPKQELQDCKAELESLLEAFGEPMNEEQYSFCLATLHSLEESIRDCDNRELAEKEFSAPVDFQRKWTELRAKMNISTAKFQEIPQEEIAEMFLTVRSLRDACADGLFELQSMEEQSLVSYYLAIKGRHEHFQNRQAPPFGLGRWKNPL